MNNIPQQHPGDLRKPDTRNLYCRRGIWYFQKNTKGKKEFAGKKTPFTLDTRDLAMARLRRDEILRAVAGDAYNFRHIPVASPQPSVPPKPVRDQPGTFVEQHYTAKEVATMLHVSLDTVRVWIVKGRRTNGRDGLFPVLKISHKVVRIPKRALDRFLKNRTF